MNNLLPESYKKLVHTEYISRLFFAISIFVIVTSAFGVVALVPAYIFSTTKLDTVRAQQEGLDRGESVKIDGDIRKLINDSKTKTKLLSEQMAGAKLLGSLEKMISVKRGEVALTSFDIGVMTEKKRQVTLGGVAANREMIVRFSKDLEGVKEFADIEVPISNFQKSTDIPFTIRFTIRYE